METYENFLNVFKVRYSNGMVKTYNEAMENIGSEIKPELLQKFSDLRHSLCLGCFDYQEIKDSSFLFKFPCGCIFCSEKCLNKFLTAIPFSKMQNFFCPCSQNFGLKELKFMFIFAASHHFVGLQKEIGRIFGEKCRGRCCLCGEICGDFGAVECRDGFGEIMGVKTFTHLICNYCSPKIETGNKFYCEMCNSGHIALSKNNVEQTDNNICNIF